METQGKYIKENSNSINKKKVLKFAGAALILAGLAGGYAVYDYETSLDHVTEPCRLCTIFGLKHQSDVINTMNDQGYFAYYQPEEVSSRRALDIVDAKVTYNDDGTKVYSVPKGYVLVGDKGVKYAETVAVEEQVIVTKTECIVNADGTCELVTAEVNRFSNDDIYPKEELDFIETVPSR